MPNLRILGLEFEDAIVMFQISILELVLIANFAKKQKFLNLGPKICDSGIFGLEFETDIVMLEISTLDFV